MKPYVRYGKGQPTPNPPNGAWGWADPAHSINPSNSVSGVNLFPAPDLVTNQMSEGVFSLNYANEPLPYRVASDSRSRRI